MASSSSYSDNKKMFTLKTSDGEVFEVEEKVAMQSETIKNMIEDDCANDNIPLPNVTGSILAKVIEYCKKHVSDEKDEEEGLKNWDKEFLNVDHPTLFNLILAANYMNVKGLLDIACQAVADHISDKHPEYVRKMFNIENDFTPEEEATIRDENKWAFE